MTVGGDFSFSSSLARALSSRRLHKLEKLCWGDPVLKNLVGTSLYTISREGNDGKCILKIKNERISRVVTGDKSS